MQPSSTLPSLFDTLSPKPNTGKPMIQEGDCGIILHPNGGVEIFSTGISSYLTGDPALWGEKELQQLEMGKKMMAISVALQNDQLMSILFDVAEGVIGPEQMANVAKH